MYVNVEVKTMKILFNIREFLWVCVSEVEDWLYPYRDRLTPEEQFEIRVKDPMSGENFMVEEVIQQQNERIERLQDEMITVQMKLAEHEERLRQELRLKRIAHLYQETSKISLIPYILNNS